MAETPPPLPLSNQESQPTPGEGTGSRPLGPEDRTDPRGWKSKGLKAAVKAAFSHAPSRPTDQALFWIIRTTIEATKTLGFPVVVSFMLLWGGYQFGNKFIEAQRTALATQQALLIQNNAAAIAAADRSTTAIKEMAAAQSESNEITRSLMMDIGLKAPKKRKATGVVLP